MTIDRTNPDIVAEVVEKLIPEGTNPRVWLEFLADSISTANDLHPNCWGVTLQKKLIRLNVGKIEALAFLPGLFHCIIDLDTIPVKINEYERDEKVELHKNKNNPAAGFYESVEGSVICNIFVEEFNENLGEVLQLIQDSHRLLIKNASRTPRHPRTKIAHSPSVIDYLSSYLGRNIQQPEYF